MTTPTVVAALIDAANEIERLGGDPSRFHKVAHEAALAVMDAGWHAPGLGEVHNADHTAMIYCEDGDGVVNDELAQRVVAALAAVPTPRSLDTFIADFEQVHGKGEA